MFYVYDNFGWYVGTSESEVPRSAPSAPPSLTLPAEVGHPHPNWTGYSWIDRPYVTPVPPTEPVPEVDATEWLIDIGAFFDRFGTEKMNVLTSANVVVQAIIRDVSVRKWVDLKRTDVAQALAVIGSIIATVTPALRTAILTTPAAPLENLALRKVYFS
jgi:hypothetical protein